MVQECLGQGDLRLEIQLRGVSTTIAAWEKSIQSVSLGGRVLGIFKKKTARIMAWNELNE